MTGYGECVVTRVGEQLRIDHADSQVMITAELLTQISAAPAPGVSITTGPTWPIGDVFRIEASNRTVVYRISQYLPHESAYLAEWPD